MKRPAEGPTAWVAFTYDEEGLARACLQSARDLCVAAVEGVPPDIEAEVAQLRELAKEILIGPTTAAVIAAARARDIPVRRLLPDRSLFQLGQGARLHRIYGSATDRTGIISQAVSQDKGLSKELLWGVGLPVPGGRAVVDAEDAWVAACEIGVPVVVKPRDYDFGHGIGLNLTTRPQILDAYVAARERSEGVLVERFVPGDDHRVLVVDGRVVAVSRRKPPSVVGDGTSTIASLVEQVNADPRRGAEPTSHLRIIRLEETELATLAEQGYHPDSVPDAGRRVLIRKNSHLRNGGSMTDETDRIHPKTAAQAVEAARVLGIDVAGLDIVAVDIARPLDEQGGAILEVNASPGFDLHIAPWASHPRPVGEAFIASLFPEGETGRIPLIAVLGDAGATATARIISLMFQKAGRQTALGSAEGIFVGGRTLSTRPGNRFEGARDLLANPAVEAAVFEVTTAGVIEEGLAFDRCDAAVVIGGGRGEGDALATDAAHCLVRTAASTGAVVLEADDPSAAALASSENVETIYFSRSGRNDVIAAHLDRAGRAVFCRDGAIVLAQGNQEEILVSPGKPSHPSDESLLAALAAGWAIGLPRDVLAAVVG